MKTVAILLVTLSCTVIKAQHQNKPAVRLLPQSGNTVVKHSEKKVYSYEKKSASGLTVQCYTREQFNQLPQARKNYYLEHKNQYQIIKINSK